ncbi:MAG: hypothetical protein IT535_10780 [Bauldia sp.]|nr:hypothetical protein [Bauldia sp.]
MASPPPDSDHWLVRPATIRRLWIGFIAILALTVLADFLVERHTIFGLEGTFGFDAWFGFIACVVLVALSKALGAFLKRSDRYYDGNGS